MLGGIVVDGHQLTLVSHAGITVISKMKMFRNVYNAIAVYPELRYKPLQNSISKQLDALFVNGVIIYLLITKEWLKNELYINDMNNEGFL